MDAVSLVIVAFLVLEGLNVAILYVAPGSRLGNGVGVFRAYEASKAQPEVHAFVSYLVNWVAGTKLIFVALLIVVLVTGSATTRLFAVVALILSVLSFYWRLYPAIRRMDAAGWIEPRGYARTLGVMIAGFVAAFAVAVVVHLSSLA